MHASLLLGMMMVGGVMTPEPEITTIPLKDDLSNLTSIQDQEWKELRKHVPLPRVPTIDDRQPLDEMRRQAGYRTGPGGYPNSMYPNPAFPNPAYQNPAQQRAMPQSPTEPGQSTGMGQAGGFTRPAAIGQPGAGFGQAPLPGGSFQPNTLTNSSPLSNRVGSPVGGMYGALPAPVAQNVANYNNNTNTSIATMERQYGLNSNSSPIGAPGGGNKPFGGYSPPSGYSPWSNLYQPTANGTQNPYTNYVRPAMDQQNFNSHISEQINGVQTMQRGYQGTPGIEVPVGAGLANPNSFLEYNYRPTY